MSSKAENQPKYKIVLTSLITRIGDGEFAPNFMLPSEIELTRKYDVSRITIRRALNELESKDIIFRIQGKGTFVKQQHVNDGYKEYSAGYSKFIINSGATSQRVQIKKAIQESGNYGKYLGLKNTDLCLVYNRIYKANKIPVFFAESLINYYSFNGFENYDYDFISISQLIHDVYKGQLFRRDRKIQSMKAGRVSKYLELGENDPILYLTYVSEVYVDNKMIPFEYAEIYARTDVIKIDPDHL